jgi:hypothetical protein
MEELMKSDIRSPALLKRAKPKAGRAAVVGCFAAIGLALLATAGCRRAPSDKGEAVANAEGKTAKGKTVQTRELTLTRDEIEKAGIKTTPVAATMRTPESMGYAVVVKRETIDQALAELSTASAVEHQSRTVLARDRRLAGTPGAMPIESQEAAERQAMDDHSALVLAQRRLSATYGRNAPWKDDYNSRVLSALAGGESKLARITFPLGTLGSSVPVKLRFVRVGEDHGSQGTESAAVWSAPADAAIPGNSFFAILPGNAVSEGERLVAYAPTGAAEEGVVVPLSAVLMADSKYWCYVEERPGVFVRTEIDERTPTDAGYFVKGGIVAGARVVTTSAGQLLAREINPTSTAEEP